MNYAVATSAEDFKTDSLSRQDVDYCFRLELEEVDLLRIFDYFLGMRN